MDPQGQGEPRSNGSEPHEAPGAPRERRFAPQPFGKYHLVDRIAVGGMAEIFLAKTFSHGGFEKRLVIKRILSSLTDNEEFVSMFVDEAKLSVLLTHPNVVQVFDFGRIGDHYFIAMEAVDGKDLKSVLRRLGERGEAIDPLFAAWICQQAARGLDYAHKKKDPEGNDLSIVHRDVSPSNVLLSYEGAVKIADFGIAKAQGTTFDTKEGVLKGKFEYMSPEQAWGRPIDRRSDVFSLGTVLWEMLTGHRLFKGASDMDTLERIRSAVVRPPRELRPELPEALEASVLRALSADPDDRYPDAASFGNDLREYLSPLAPDEVAERFAPWMLELFIDDVQDEKARVERNSREALLQLDVDDDIELEETPLLDPVPLSAGEFVGAERGREVTPPPTPLPRGAESPEGASPVLPFGGEGAASARAHSPRSHPAAGAPRPAAHPHPPHSAPRTVVPAEPATPRSPFRPIAAGFLVIALALLGAWFLLRGLPGEGSGGDLESVASAVPAPTEAGGEAGSPVEAQPEPAVEPPPDPPEAVPPVAPTASPVAAVPRSAGAVAARSQPPKGGEAPAPPGSGEAAGVMILESRPSGAEVRVNGRTVGRTPYQFTSGRAGEVYAIELALDGHEGEAFSQDFPKSGTLRVSRTLSPRTAAALGNLSVRVNGGFADLYIDGAPKGKAPRQLQLPPGTYQVRLVNAAAGFDRTVAVTVQSGQTASVSETLGE